MSDSMRSLRARANGSDIGNDVLNNGTSSNGAPSNGAPSNGDLNNQKESEVLKEKKKKKERPSFAARLSNDRGGETRRDDGRIELTEADAYEKLGYSFPVWKKWMILSVMFIIQISINLNASLYANGVKGIAKKFNVSEQAARVPQLTFLCAYAFGCELWAPWSEELGRFPTQQLSLFLVNIWQIPCALAPNYGTLVICRLLGGVSTAGGSVTLGVLADMWEPDDQEYAIAFLVLSSVGGSVVGAVVGGFVEAYQPLKWIFWVQLIFGGSVQLIHLILVPETRATILLDREAKKRRKAGEKNIYGPNELRDHRLTFREILIIWSRPFYMLFTEPIVAWLSAVSGFSDNLIFIFLQGFTPVYAQWGFGIIGTSLAFIPLLVGYILAYLSFLPSIFHFRRKRAREGSASVSPEKRLWWLLFCLFIFAWTSLGPKYHIPWIAPMIGSALVGIANYAVYQSSIDYTVAAYGPYAASATGGNDFARDFLSGIAALYSVPLYSNIGKKYPLEYASTILACISVLVTAPLYYFYMNGEKIRLKSKFASEIAADREKQHEGRRRRSTVAGGGGGGGGGGGSGGALPEDEHQKEAEA